MRGVAHIDLNITEHCNFSCLNCSHFSPLHKPWFMSLDQIERDLTTLKTVLKTTTLNIVGGEPTLHPKLLEIMRLVKRIRIDEQTHLITNGSLLPRMGDDFWSELEFLKVSIYPKLDSAIPELVRAKSEQFGFGHEMTEFNEFFRQLKDVPDDGVESFNKCHWKSDCYTVHRGFFYLCPQSAFWPGKETGVDGISLDGITAESLDAFMDRKEPLEACRNCAAANMDKNRWRESKRDVWLNESKSTRYIPTAEEESRMME